jgi:WD40 repeat protein
MGAGPEKVKTAPVGDLSAHRRLCMNHNSLCRQQPKESGAPLEQGLFMPRPRPHHALYALVAVIALYGYVKGSFTMTPNLPPVPAYESLVVAQPAAKPEPVQTTLVLPDYMEDLDLHYTPAAAHPGSLAISANGKVGANIQQDGMILVWDTESFLVRERIPTAIYNRPSALALSADGNLLAIGGLNSALILRTRNDPTARTEADKERRLQGHSGAISALAFSPDDKLLISGSDDASTIVWDVKTGNRLHTFDSRLNGSYPGGIPVGFGFSGDKRTLLVNEWYSRHYDVARGTSLWDLDEGIELGIRDVAPPNTDNVIRSGQAIGANNWLLAYTSDEGLALERLDSCDKAYLAGPASSEPTGSYAQTVAADPKGRWVAAIDGRADKQNLHLYATHSGIADLSLELPVRPITLLPHPDGKTIFVLAVGATRLNGNKHFIIGRDAETVTAGSLFSITLPDAVTQWPAPLIKPDAARCPPSAAARKEWSYRLPATTPLLPVLAKLQPPLEILNEKDEYEDRQQQIYPPNSLYFADNGNLYVLHHGTMSDSQSGVVIWDIQAKRVLRSHFQLYVNETVFRLHEGWGAIAGEHYNQILDLLTGQLLLDKNSTHQGSSSIATDSETGEIYRMEDGHLARYDANVKPLPPHTRKNDVTVTAFAAYNGNYVTMGGDGSGTLWNTFSGKSQPFKSGITLDDNGGGLDGQMRLSADGQFIEIPTSYVDGPLNYNIVDLRRTTTITQGPVLGSFPKYSSRVVVPDERLNQIDVWDLKKSELLARLPRQPGLEKTVGYLPLRAALSEDGRRLASASSGGLLRVWDLETKRVIGEASVGSNITTLAFNASGALLAISTEAGDVLLFDTAGKAVAQKINAQ